MLFQAVVFKVGSEDPPGILEGVANKKRRTDNESVKESLVEKGLLTTGANQRIYIGVSKDNLSNRLSFTGETEDIETNTLNLLLSSQTKLANY